MALVAISVFIGRSVRATSEAAMRSYPGDAVEALVSCMADKTHTLRERNRAVWALGQLGDRRALPALREHFTGQQCNHTNGLCQYELEKAIKLIDGGINVTAWAWRGWTSL